MARTLPAGMAADLAETVTEPRLLLYIGFKSPAYLYSGSGTIAYAGQTWVGNGFRRTDFSMNPDGTQTLRIDLPNNDSSMSTAVLLQPAAARIACRLYEREGANTVLVMDGWVLDFPQLVGNVTMVATNRNPRNTYAPRLTIAPHIFNHITPAGTVVTWGQYTITLTGADDA